MLIGHEAVVYRPSKSTGFGHQARLRDARAAWASTVRFLQTHTRHVLTFVTLDVTGSERAGDPRIAAQRRREAEQLFGAPASESWRLDETQLPAAIAFALDDDKWPRFAAPSRLVVSIEFAWLAYPPPPEGDLPPPYERTFGSTLDVHLGNHRVFLQPDLFVPLPYDSPELHKFLWILDAALPFRIRDQYFQRLLPSGKSGWGQTRRLPRNWRGGATAVS